MRVLIVTILLLCSIHLNAQESSEIFNTLPFGSVKPTGWLKEQMQKDVAGFVGNLDRIVPELINDPIYASGRLGKIAKLKTWEI